MALDTCPERSFMTQLYFGIQKEYQKQPPKTSPLYLDRLRPTPGLLLPTVRSYGKSIETNLRGVLYRELCKIGILAVRQVRNIVTELSNRKVTNASD